MYLTKPKKNKENVFSNRGFIKLNVYSCFLHCLVPSTLSILYEMYLKPLGLVPA